MWTYQATELTMSAASGSATLFEMSINQVHGHPMYEFAGELTRVRPFVFGGAGATFLSASDLDGEVKPALDVGAGVKWFLQRHFGVEGRVRYTPTQLNDSSIGVRSLRVLSGDAPGHRVRDDFLCAVLTVHRSPRRVITRIQSAHSVRGAFEMFTSRARSE
jgi:hypothetical protein